MSKCFPENEQHNNLTNYKWKFLFTTYIPEPTIFRILLNIHTILAEVANNCLLIFISLIISDDEYFLHNHYYHVLFNDEASSPNLMLLLFCYWVYMSWKWPFNVWCTIFFQLVRISFYVRPHSCKTQNYFSLTLSHLLLLTLSFILIHMWKVPLSSRSYRVLSFFLSVFYREVCNQSI